MYKPTSKLPENQQQESLDVHCINRILLRRGVHHRVITGRKVREEEEREKRNN